MVASRTEFFKVMQLFARCQLEPKLMTSDGFVKEVMDTLDDIDNFNEIASRLQATYYQYTIDQQHEKTEHTNGI
jgi:hypothetical protein